VRVFVTSASSFIGSAVVTQLIGAGHRVTGLARSDGGADRLAALGADVHRAELTQPDRVSAAAAAADGVIHLVSRHGDDFAEAVHTDVEVVEALGDALAGSDRPSVVTSDTFVLPSGRLVTEVDTPDPAAPAGARRGGERAAPALADRGVRLSVVWLATGAGTDAPAFCAVTRRLLDWETTHPGLLDDLDHSKFFEPVPG
jgi:nucleoside-diphosphate-sugar epimerase